MPEQFIIDKTGKKISVILSIEEYEAILKDLQYLPALAELADELQKNPTASIKSIVKKLQYKDLLKELI